MTKKQTTAARRAREHSRASGQKYTHALRGWRDAPAIVLSRCLRRAGLTVQAAVLASYTREARAGELELLAGDDPDCRAFADSDQLALDLDGTLIESVFRALIAAASRPVPVELLPAAVEALASLDVHWAADVIRHRVLGLVPAPVETASARLACAAAHALASAAEVPYGGDEEWNACMRLLEHALDLARQAAAVRSPT